MGSEFGFWKTNRVRSLVFPDLSVQFTGCFVDRFEYVICSKFGFVGEIYIPKFKSLKRSKDN